MHALAASTETAVWASCVLAPRCGVSSRFGADRSGLSAGGGSAVYTSSAAPAQRPLCSASTSAASSTIPPRAALTTYTPSRQSLNVSASSMPVVSAVLGTWKVSASACGASSSKERNVFTVWPASCRSACTKGSWPTTFMPKANARSATVRPIRPSPTTPSVSPCSWRPCSFERSQRPARIEASAGATFRIIAISSVKACSAVVIVEASAVLTTRMPFAVAAARSMLSTPTPARAMTWRSPGSASTSAVTSMPERTIIACTPPRLSSSAYSPSLSPGRSSSSASSCERIQSSPSGASLSAARMTFFSVASGMGRGG